MKLKKMKIDLGNQDWYNTKETPTSHSFFENMNKLLTMLSLNQQHLDI